MAMHRTLAYVAICLLTACAEQTPKPASAPMVGSDRDQHGCIPSAGYSWCARTQQCERPWELAKQQGLASGQQAFDNFCSSPQAAQGVKP